MAPFILIPFAYASRQRTKADRPPVETARQLAKAALAGRDGGYPEYRGDGLPR